MRHVGDRAIAIALSVVLGFAAFALGAAHGGTSAVIQIALWLLVATRLIFAPPPVGAPRPPRGVLTAGGLLLAYLAFQLVPLPASVLSTLSPATAALYRRTIEPSATTETTAASISAVGAPDRQKISLEERKQIQELAAHRQPDPNRWRPIALNPFAAERDWLRYLAYGLALWLAATIAAPRTLLRGVAIVGIAVAAVGLLQRATWNGHILWILDRFEGPPLAEETRVLGSFVNPDHFAAFLAMALFPTWALVGRELRRGGHRDSTGSTIFAVVFAIGTALIVAALVGSASRGALLGMMAGGAVLLIARLFTEMSRPSESRSQGDETTSYAQAALRWLPAGLGCAILIAGFFFADAMNRGTLDQRLGGGEASLRFRFDLWKQSLGIVQDFPLFGVGAGGWREIFLRYERYPLTWLRPNHAHNDYLEWLTEVGAVGMLITVALVWATLRWASANQSISTRMRWPLVASVIAIGIHSFGDFNLRAGANALAVSVLLGLLCNPHWRLRSRARAAIVPPRHSFATLATVAAALVLCIASGTKLRESLQWVRIHRGAAWLEFAPRDPASWEEVGKLLYENGFRYQAPTADAFRTAIELRPTSAGTHWLLALASPRLEARRRAMETALFLRPSAAAWRLQYAKVLARTGEIDGALAQLEEASYLDPRINEQRYLRGDGVTPAVVQAAERGFGRALAERPGDVDLLVEMAGFYDSTRNGDSAARLWREAAIASKDWPQYGLRAAESYLRTGNRQKAGEILKELMSLAPSSEAAYRHLALDVLLPDRHFDEAARVVRSGIDRGADAAPLYVALAAVERARGDEPLAREALGRAQEAGRWEPEVQYNIGKEYLQVGDLEQAGWAFERAFELKPDVSWYAFMLGETRERMYDLEGALAAYRQAAALNPREEVFRERVLRIEQLASAGDASRSRQ